MVGVAAITKTIVTTVIIQRRRIKITLLVASHPRTAANLGIGKEQALKKLQPAPLGRALSRSRRR